MEPAAVDRFHQIEPKVLFVVDGYRYGGKSYDKMSIVNELIDQLPSVEKVVLLPYLNPEQADFSPKAVQMGYFRPVSKRCTP
ncbi:MAG: hypothetical protein R2769_17055 [Saprospiraceae bacterium]